MSTINYYNKKNQTQLLGLVSGLGGLVLMLASSLSGIADSAIMWTALALMSFGIIIYSIGTYKDKLHGIHNDGVWYMSVSNRSLLAWLLGVIITGFYILLYFKPELLGQGADDMPNTGLVAFFDPLSMFLKGKPASQWFVYGTLYTVAIIGFGFKFILKYRGNRYQTLRTLSVMFFQLGFAFLIPSIMEGFNYPYYDAKNMWPLNYYFFNDRNINGFLSAGNFGLFMLILGLLLIFLISPILTYFYGKRWYCSWVCGCGGLAETAGDPFRHLSSKSTSSWKIERWLIYMVLAFSIIMTVAVVYSNIYNHRYELNLQPIFLVLFVTVIAIISLYFMWVKAGKYFSQHELLKKGVTIAISLILAIIWISYFTKSSNAFFIDSNQLNSIYGFYIGSIFSGVIGVGFYPIMGSRVWCRFGCPMAAILGLQQKFFSRFRITTNGGQCISCGNCSNYCEMGIDVRSYAQRGENIIRSSCVGCGICASVCPRGVLRLETGKLDITDKSKDMSVIKITESGVSLEQ
ncbi:MAG: 4Fe-4S binding protein [Saprospiraceae bacterium]